MEKTVKIIISLLIFITLSGTIARIVYLNNRFPLRKDKYIDCGTTDEIDSDIYMTIDDVETYNPSDLSELYEKCDIEPVDVTKVVYVDLTLENKTDRNLEYELYKLYLETEDNKVNGLVRELFFELNDTDMIVEIPANDKVKVKLPYEITKYMLTSSECEQLKLKDLYLVMKRYPVKEFWRL